MAITSTVRLALVGNPNCGKTTLFNALTGARQHVGNWPGVTVEREEGIYFHGETEVRVTDLPGIYSFSAFSPDEIVARNHILLDRPDIVVNIIDATNIERNLYLTLQLLEMRVPLIVALNMVDLAQQKKINIDIDHFSSHLGCPVIPIVASKNHCVEKLRDAVSAYSHNKVLAGLKVAYDSEAEKAIEKLQQGVAEVADSKKIDRRWLAITLLEGDELARAYITDEATRQLVDEESRWLHRHTGEDAEVVMANGRYGFIHGLARDVVQRDPMPRRSFTDLIDHVVLHRYVGIPLFFLVMYLVFAATVKLSAPFITFIDRICTAFFINGLGSLLSLISCPNWLVALLVGGVGEGIRTVSMFVPPIFLIFFCLALLEDSGYMARAAFIMDRLLRIMGLPGRAFIPMLVGFGCNVPGILAARTLENPRDRIMAIIINPFMSCGARLPVYALFAATFFPASGGQIIFGIYLMGIVLAVLSGLLFKQTILRGEISTFVMELPSYHLPTLGGILFHTWSRLKDFIFRAGKLIIAVIIILNILNSVAFTSLSNGSVSRQSVLQTIAKGIIPVFYPMGLRADDWPAVVALFTGVMAKEAIVGTLIALYNEPTGPQEAAADRPKSHGPINDGRPVFQPWASVKYAFAAIPEGFHLASVREATVSVPARVSAGLKEHFDGPLGAVAYLLFVLIYAPCLATLTVIYKETNWRWALFVLVYLTALAWVVAVLFYQVGLCLRGFF